MLRDNIGRPSHYQAFFFLIIILIRNDTALIHNLLGDLFNGVKGINIILDGVPSTFGCVNFLRRGSLPLAALSILFVLSFK